MSAVRIPVSLLFVSILTSMTGCVTPIPLSQEAPDLSYTATAPMVVAVIDEREQIQQDKPATYIGRAHGAFGIPSDMDTYPWFVSDKSKKEQSLAEALEERIVFGLNDEGWALVGADLAKRPTRDETVGLLADREAKGLVQFVITQWFVSINLNWVTAFNFDWGYELDVLDENGLTVASIKDSGRDVVDEEAKQSPQNTIKMAFRDRLIKIFERPDVRRALEQQGRYRSSEGSSARKPDKAAPQVNSELRAVSGTERDECAFITSITKGAGGSGDVSRHVERAMDTALKEASGAGANAYFVVESITSGSGATVIVEALRCD